VIRRRRPRFYAGEWKDVVNCILGRDQKSEENIRCFEERFAEYTGSKHAIATCSGRNALELILEAVNLSPGDEVIIPAYTLKDLVSMIKSMGLHPVFADVKGGSFNIDPDSVEKEITSRTKVIIATHLFGVPCDMDRITTIAREHDLKVIEDCAHAAGAEYKGKKVGSLGDASLFSFEMTKLINTFGGGMVVTGDEVLAGRIREKVSQYPDNTRSMILKIVFLCLENLLIQGPLFPMLLYIYRKNEEFVKGLYWKAHAGTRLDRTKYTGLQASLGLEQLKKLDDREILRRKNACCLIKGMEGTVTAQVVLEETQRVYYFMVVRIKARESLEAVRDKLFSRGVDCGIGEEITDNCAELFGGSPEDATVATELYSSNLQLPTYDVMTEREIKKITDAVKDVLGREADR
jgi:perosamine synthetase